MVESIFIRRNCLVAVANEARSSPERECCGLLAGNDGVIARVFPAWNATTHPEVAYEIAPEELFRLMRAIRGARLDFLGIYHSHLKDENVPSPSDVERAYYPRASYFILLPDATATTPVRAFAIRDGQAAELEIQIVEN